jgi:hypothetical protein
MTPDGAVWAELPGGEILDEGLQDLARGVESVPALLLLIAAPRLERLGIGVASMAPRDADSAWESALYQLLCERHGRDGYGQYNAWLRRLDSLASALERRASDARRARRSAPGV